jgi:hypothetical protein
MDPKNKFLMYSNLVGGSLLGAALILHDAPHVENPMCPTAPTVLRVQAVTTATATTFNVPGLPTA